MVKGIKDLKNKVDFSFKVLKYKSEERLAGLSYVAVAKYLIIHVVHASMHCLCPY